MIIKMIEYVSAFAEDKDTARDIRNNIISPALANNEEVILDFTGISSATQSFIHALIRELIKEFGIDCLDKMKFKECNQQVKTIIQIVVAYIQDSQDDEYYSKG